MRAFAPFVNYAPVTLTAIIGAVFNSFDFMRTLTVRVAKRVVDDEVTHLASGVAYYATLSIIPLMLGLLAISGAIWDSESLERNLVNVVSANLVTANLPGSHDLMEENAAQLAEFAGRELGELKMLSDIPVDYAEPSGNQLLAMRAEAAAYDTPISVGEDDIFVVVYGVYELLE